MQETKSVVRAKLIDGGRAVIAPTAFSALTRAADILDHARGQAERIVARARVEAENILSEARDAGRQEGLAEVTELLLAARVQGEALRRQAVSSLVALAVRVAEKVLAAEIQMRPELVEARVMDALDQVAWCRRIVVRVAPQDLEILQSRRGDLLARFPEASLDLVADPEISRGGCRIDSEAGQIDATLESQLAAIERALTESVDE